MPSESSSSELFAPGAEAYYRKVLKLDEPQLRCTCGHKRDAHEDGKHRCTKGKGNTCGCQSFTCDHSACGWKPRHDDEGNRLPEPAVGPLPFIWHSDGRLCEDEYCERYHAQVQPVTVDEYGHRAHKWKRCDQCRHSEHSSACTVCRCLAVTAMEDIAMTCRRAGGCPEHPVRVELRQEPEEPPLTPEEEEEAPVCVDECGSCEVCGTEPFCVHPEGYEGECPCLPSCTCCKAEAAEPPPPQPERRPPYAVAYSVDGHFYELALPGDATAQAVDGALIITHSLGQVAGIVRIMPMQKEAS